MLFSLLHCLGVLENLLKSCRTLDFRFPDVALARWDPGQVLLDQQRLVVVGLVSLGVLLAPELEVGDEGVALAESVVVLVEIDEISLVRDLGLPRLRRLRFQHLFLRLVEGFALKLFRAPVIGLPHTFL